MVTAFYAYLIPLAIPVGILGILLHYMLQKYLLLNRHASPLSVSDSMASYMLDFFIEIIIVIYAVGCIVFEKIIYDQVSTVTLIQLIISLAFLLLPIPQIFNCLLRVKRESTVGVYNDQDFNDVILFINNDSKLKKFNHFQDYDRSNPVLAEAAIE